MTELEATVSFLDADNGEIDTEEAALNVSNWVTDEDLPGTSDFRDTSDDPDNFRLQVDAPSVTAGQVDVTLTVKQGDGTDYTLNKKNGGMFRGQFLRLVTDGPDDGVSGNQTIKVALGDELTLSYTTASDIELEKTIMIGRPASEDDNGTNQLKHDIRELKVNVVVFREAKDTALDGDINDGQQSIPVDDISDAQSSGSIKIGDELIGYTGLDQDDNEFTGCTRGVDGTTAAAHGDDTSVHYDATSSSISEAELNQDMDVVEDRLAQSTIRLSRPLSVDDGQGAGRGVPTALLDGYGSSSGGFVTAINDDETEVINLKDNDANSIDVFYVTRLDGAVGSAYPDVRNRTGNPNADNFIIIDADDRKFATLAHEIMHILLNSPHRADPETALFHGPTDAMNTVGATKRIGPYPDASDAGVGTGDTSTIRNRSENLP